MKADIHPEYKEVVFQDVTSDFKFLTRSTLGSKETIKWEDGNEYPLIKVDVSSATHPFYTGQNKIMATSGRVDKFRKRYRSEEHTSELQSLMRISYAVFFLKKNITQTR